MPGLDQNLMDPVDPSLEEYLGPGNEPATLDIRVEALERKTERIFGVAIYETKERRPVIHQDQAEAQHEAFTRLADFLTVHPEYPSGRWEVLEASWRPAEVDPLTAQQLRARWLFALAPAATR